MTEPKPTPTSLPMPVSGGSYIRQPDGSLVKKVDEPPVAAAKAEKPQKPLLTKEAPDGN